MEITILVLGVFYLASQNVKLIEFAAIIPFGLFGAFFIGVLVGDIYVFIFYPELRWAWPFGNPFVPPGAKNIVPRAVPPNVMK
ncbi:MAG: hypothetical protein UZ21_OP11001000660 [Microgenomates bacterium OLB22]|nr:MAG: hypothetical protein UZ21_OP11001000660 [Microgenomates bacterium OLB22]